MRRERFIKVFYICFSLLAMMLFAHASEVKADYTGCNVKIEGTDYYDCGNNVYTYPEERGKSSMIYSKKPTESIVYGGKVDGYSVFIANGFKFYNRTYDDKTRDDNNIWTIISRNNHVIFDGSFEDSWLLDETHEGYYRGGTILKEGTYTIIQYHRNGEVLRKIVVYNVRDTEYSAYMAGIDVFKYDNDNIESNVATDVLSLNNNILVRLTGNFGVKNMYIKVNGVEIKCYIVDGKWVVINSLINDAFNKGEINEVEIYIRNYLGFENRTKYLLNVLNNNVSIHFSSISSSVISTSRRIVVNANAGIGKTLDTDYCWYYWSTSPNDGLTYEEFLRNYAKSPYKGSYSEDKGVILRNTSGTYYLYALAKDDDSTLVARSDGYTLDDDNLKVSYNVYDGILIVALLISAIFPIAIYLFIRKRGY